jgi:GntR family transcriptional regulator
MAKSVKRSIKAHRAPRVAARKEGVSAIQAIAAELIRDITGGQFEIGARFTTERELRDRFGVGRHTIRESLKVLTEQGLLGRRRKTGTFVLATSPVTTYVHSLRNLRSLLDFAETTELQVKHVRMVSLDEPLLASFKDLTDPQWLRISGLRYVRAEGTFLCWSEILIPEHLAPSRQRLLSTSRALYEETMTKNGLRLEYVEQEVTAATLSPEFAASLAAAGNSSALLVKRRYVAHTGQTFEVSQNLYPAGHYRIKSIIRQRA